MGIRKVNMSECTPLMNASATVPPFAPTTTNPVVRAVAPVSGRLKELTLLVAAPGTHGNSTDHIQKIDVNKRGVTGAVSAVALASQITLKSSVTGSLLLRTAGDIIRMRGVAGNHVVQGEIIDVLNTEAGTLGTGTRATFSILDMAIEADQNIDASRV